MDRAQITGTRPACRQANIWGAEQHRLRPKASRLAPGSVQDW
jgi:hypothetical protein